MKTYTTNYYNTLIVIAEDCPAEEGKVPPIKKERTIANMQFDIIKENPYQYTSDDVLFLVFTERNRIDDSRSENNREEFFSKPQACFRSSPLAKRYGWGIHFDEEGKVALYGCETNDYRRLISDSTLSILKAMKSKR